MAISTAAALLGSAVIGAGSSIYAGSQAKSAANKTAAAQERAAQQQLQLQRESLAKAEQLQTPFIQGGYAAFDDLLRELGVGGSPGGVSAGAVSDGGSPADKRASMDARQAAPQPDYGAYFANNPDLGRDPSLANFNPGDLTGDGKVDDADRGAWHYQNYGQGEGRALPTTQPAPAPAADGQQQAPAATQTGRDLMTADRPAWGERPEFTRPGDVGGPGSFTFDPSKIAEDPGYKFRLSEGLNAVNTFSAARGKLRSGDAAMALQQRGEGLAAQETQNAFERALRAWSANADQYRYQQNRSDNIFANDRAYDTGMWQYQGERGDRNFEADRAYQTNRYDARIGNLFSLAGIGQGAAGAATGAQSNYAANAGNIFGSQAQAQADAAAAKAAANSQIAGGIAAGAGNLFASWGGGAQGPSTGTTVSQAWNAATGGGWQSPYNPAFINTPASIRF